MHLLVIDHRFFILKGGYLDFSHLTKLKNIIEMYMKKQYRSSIIKNHKIKKTFYFRWCSLKRLRSLLSYFQILHQLSNEAFWENQVTDDD